MSTFKKLEHVSNWNGGSWTLDGKHYNISIDVDYLVMAISGTDSGADNGCVEGSGRNRYGADYDHGHTHEWKSTDIILKLQTPIGVVYSSLYDFMEDNPDTAVYVKEVDY